MRRHVDLDLGGQVYRLVPGAAALLRVAEEVENPFKLMIATAAMAETGILPDPAHMLRTLHIAMVESGYQMTREAAFEKLHSAGAFALLEPYAEFVGGLVNGGVVPESEAAAAGDEKKTAAATRSRKSRGDRSSQRSSKR